METEEKRGGEGGGCSLVFSQGKKGERGKNQKGEGGKKKGKKRGEGGGIAVPRPSEVKKKV